MDLGDIQTYTYLSPLSSLLRNKGIKNTPLSVFSTQAPQRSPRGLVGCHPCAALGGELLLHPPELLVDLVQQLGHAGEVEQRRLRPSLLQLPAGDPALSELLRVGKLRPLRRGEPDDGGLDPDVDGARSLTRGGTHHRVVDRDDAARKLAGDAQLLHDQVDHVRMRTTSPGAHVRDAHQEGRHLPAVSLGREDRVGHVVVVPGVATDGDPTPGKVRVQIRTPRHGRHVLRDRRHDQAAQLLLVHAGDPRVVEQAVTARLPLRQHILALAELLEVKPLVDPQRTAQVTIRQAGDAVLAEEPTEPDHRGARQRISPAASLVGDVASHVLEQRQSKVCACHDAFPRFQFRVSLCPVKRSTPI